MGAGVGDNAIAVGLLNLCIVFGQIRGGGLLDRMGPHFYLRIAWQDSSRAACSTSGGYERRGRLHRGRCVRVRMGHGRDHPALVPRLSSRMTWMSSSASTRS